jgi:hypothetical protein
MNHVLGRACPVWKMNCGIAGGNPNSSVIGGRGGCCSRLGNLVFTLLAISPSSSKSITPLANCSANATSITGGSRNETGCSAGENAFMALRSFAGPDQLRLKGR